MVFRRFFLLLILACAFASSGHTTSSGFYSRCKDLLHNFSIKPASPTAEFTFDDWRTVYWQAREQNQPQKAAYALTHLLQMKGKELELSFGARRALRTLVQAYEDPYIPPRAIEEFTRWQKINPWFRVKHWWKNLNTPTLMHQDSAHFLFSRSDKLNHLARLLAVDMAWSMGPFGFRLAPELLVRQWGGKLSKEILDKVVLKNRVVTYLGLPYDDFTDSLLKTYFTGKSIKRAIRMQQEYSILRPLVMVFGSFVLGNVTNAAIGTGIFPHPLEAYANHQLPTYPENQFLGDFEKQTGRSYHGKKVTMILEKNLLTDYSLLGDSVGTVNPSSMLEVKIIGAQAGEFKPIVVDSVQSLNAALTEAQDSDFVFIEAHGMPGEFSIGPKHQDISANVDQISVPHLKKGATLVFVSCSFGDQYISNTKDLRSETWVRLADKILGADGMAVASTNDIMSIGFSFAESPNPAIDLDKFDHERPVVAPVPVASAKAPTSHLLNSLHANGIRALNAFALLGQRTFIGPVMEREKIEEAGTRLYAYGRSGLRVYDANTHTATYYQH